jgi:hypothetical protein
MQAPKIRPLYAENAKFEALAAHYDAHGKFRNRFLETTLYGS